MNDVHNGYQAAERFLNVMTKPSSLLVLLVMIMAMVLISDPTDMVVICAVMAGLFLASQTAVGIVAGLGDTHVTNVKKTIPWGDFDGDEDEAESGYFGDADEVDDIYG